MTIKQQKEYDKKRRKAVISELGITDTDYSYMANCNKILNRLYTNSCNGFEDEQLEKQNDSLIEEYEQRAKTFAKDNKLEIYFQTDPRGATIYLDTKEIPVNSYNNAHCIY